MTTISNTEKFNLFAHKLANTTSLHIVYKTTAHKTHNTHGTLNAWYLASIGVEVPESKYPFLVYYDLDRKAVKRINCRCFLTFCKD